jgi:RiboL-PSP-HEPN
MPTERIASCTLRLNEDLDEVVAALDFATSAFKTYASSGEILSWIAGEDELRTVVEQFRSSRLSDLNFLHQSLYVQAWSAFELFIRLLIVSYVEEVCNRADDFESLNKAKLIEHNLYHTGVTLQQIRENRSNFAIDFFTVAKNVGTSIPESRKVVLNAPSFVMFLGGPSVRGIEEALKRVGFKEFNWDKVGEAPPVQKAFGTRKTRETAKQVTEFLQSAEKTRNNIVHCGENIQPVTEADLRQEICVFRAVGDALAEFLKQSVP